MGAVLTGLMMSGVGKRLSGPLAPTKMVPVLLEDEGKQRANLRGSLFAEASCVGNASSVLARPIIPLLCLGKSCRGLSSENPLESMHPVRKPASFV